MPAPRIVHELTPAPAFVGRERELEELHARWRSGYRGVLALVGLGGAGKTAIVAQFVQSLLADPAAARPHGAPHYVFVWSFYRDSDTAEFLREAYRYFAPEGSAAAQAGGLGILHKLYQSLDSGGPHLLVLDGLERIQIAGGGRFGGLEDPVLKSLLLRIASGTAPVTALITSRFPVTDLAGQPGFQVVDVEGLEVPAAVDLLRRRGVRGDDEQLRQLAQVYDGHALALDHFGGLIGQLLDGDASRAPELTEAAHGESPEAGRLGRLLRSYERHLPADELELLSKLCLLRGCVTTEQATTLLLCTPPARPHTARALADALARFMSDGFPESAAEIARAVAETIESLVFAAPTAGPADSFRRDVLEACDKQRMRVQDDLPRLVGELARLYLGRELDAPDDERPLDAADRERLADLCGRYLRLIEHPDMLYQESTALQQVAQSLSILGFADAPARRGEVHFFDVMMALKTVQVQLRRLAAKHLAVIAARQVVRRYQEKWQLAGALAGKSAAEIAALIESLLGRHLLLAEGDGALNVHPAVRDFFRQRVTRQDAWHSLILDHLVTLVGAPGGQYVEEKRSLDMVEEAIYHAVEIGDEEQALSLYEKVLGGHPHLAWKLGEVVRGMRIMKMFSACPDPWAMAWYLRCLGELEESFETHTLSHFLANIRLLQGRLPDVAQHEDDHASAVAAFLMGTTTRIPTLINRCAVPLGRLYLYRGDLATAARVSRIEDVYGRLGWEGERALCLLVLAHVALLRGEVDRCRQRMDSAAGWIVHSGSVEHLCQLHLMRARVSDDDDARRAVDDGIHLASQCGLRLLHVELLCQQAAKRLSASDAPGAEASAREALQRSEADGCQFAWGAAESGRLLGAALLDQHRRQEARQVLEDTLATQQRIKDPAAESTQQLLLRA